MIASLFGTSTVWLTIAQLLWWPFLVWIVLRAPWRYLNVADNLNRFLAFSVAQGLLWQIRADIVGLNLHLLGATVMTLMFGWRLATLGGSLAMAFYLLRGETSWEVLVCSAWVTVALPVAVSYAFARFIERWLPSHFFVYVYFSAFAGGALSMLAVGLANVALLPSPTGLGEPLLPYVLLMFPEAFLSGGLITLMAVYLPHWVASFDDRRYLYRK